MKKFKTLLVTILALSMVLGSTMTAFAAEEETINQLTDKTVGVYVDYTVPEGIPDERNSTPEPVDPVYSIQISYDSLEFSYVAESIRWNEDAGTYVVNLVDTNSTKAVQITNTAESNVSVRCTPFLDNSAYSKVNGVSYTMELSRNGEVISEVSSSQTNYPTANVTPVVLAPNTSDQLEVSMKSIGFDPDVKSFDERIQFADLHLRFDPDTGGRDFVGGSY